ncbi:MAG TPA: NADPH-dependent F420 reductase [Terriglobales bacterium]|nr:NADPH-dependent F420 reductase [Terriglobales bacterium]
MKIAVVGGTGAEGSGLARRWFLAGLDVIIGSRDEKRGQAAAEKIAATVPGKGTISGAENQEAVQQADVVVLTVPFESQVGMLKQIKASLKPGTVLIDNTVPLAAAVGGRLTRTLLVWQGSAAQQTAELVPEGVAVAAAFQNVSHELLAHEGPIDCDVIVCSDDDRARSVAFELVHAIPGLRAVDGGKLENARIVEQITALLITINVRRKGHGAGIRITGI